MTSLAPVVETARVERLTAGDHEWDRSWDPVAAIEASRNERPNRTLSAWLHEQNPHTGTYRLVTSWGARSDEIEYRSRVA